MTFQPLCGREGFESGSELAVNIRPCILEVGKRERIGVRPIRVGQVDFIERGIQPVTDAEQFEEPVINGDQVSDNIDHSIAVGCDLSLELVFSKSGDALAYAIDYLLPGAYSVGCEDFFGSHTRFDDYRKRTDSGFSRQAMRYSVAALDLATQEWLEKSARQSNDEEEQERLHAIAEKFLGAIEGPGDRSVNVSRLVRERSRRRYGR